VPVPGAGQRHRNSASTPWHAASHSLESLLHLHTVVWGWGLRDQPWQANTNHSPRSRGACVCPKTAGGNKYQPLLAKSSAASPCCSCPRHWEHHGAAGDRPGRTGAGRLSQAGWSRGAQGQQHQPVRGAPERSPPSAALLLAGQTASPRTTKHGPGISHPPYPTHPHRGPAAGEDPWVRLGQPESGTRSLHQPPSAWLNQHALQGVGQQKETHLGILGT